MRVIAGSARGRTLRAAATAPRGRRRTSRPGGETRPTSDLVRGVIFDMLDALGADYTRVLDLYAGTGALGIEALSRGDGTADFVERDAAAAAVIDENLRRTGFDARARVHRFAVEHVPARLAGPYTLVLADPPYYDVAAQEALQSVAASVLITPETVLVFEHHRRTPSPARFGPLPLYRDRRHGDTVVAIYALEIDVEEEA